MRIAILSTALFFAAACSAPAVTAADGAPQRTLTVTGEGKVAAAPDMALITIGVGTDGKDAGDALSANNAAMAATIDQLKALGVEGRDIQTSGLTVNPRYRYDRPTQTQELIGFRAENTVRVRLRDLDKAGTVIDQAVKSGANTLNGISFTFSDPKPLLDEARRGAVTDAKARAVLLADAAGVRLGPILTIQDGYASAPQPSGKTMIAEAGFDAAATPIKAGESTVRAQVTLIYEID